MPKLLFVVSEDWYFVSHRLSLAVEARAQGYDVAVVTRLSKFRDAIEAAGIRVIPFETNRRGLSPLSIIREVATLARIYRYERPDILHHVALRMVVVGGLAAKVAGIRRVISAITGMGFLFTVDSRLPVVRRILQKVLPLAISKGLTIVQNSDDATLLYSLGVLQERVRLIPGAGVDTDLFRPADLREARPIVMMASRLLWDKGVAEFIEAGRLLRGHGARFVLVGMADAANPAAVSESDLESLTRDGDVEWWGDSNDMAATLGRAEVVCLPSYREGLPKVLLEAMACAKPCVTTDVPGCRDAVRDGDNGFLVPARDADALADAIRRLLGDRTMAKRMGCRGRERVVAEFSQEKVARDTLKVYRELLE